MDRTFFLTEFLKASDQLDRKRIKFLTKRSIDAATNADGGKYGQRNLIIVMEELAELSQEVSKMARGIGNKTGLLEEMADVALGLAYLQDIGGVSTLDLYKAINTKLDRLEWVLNNNGVYK